MQTACETKPVLKFDPRGGHNRYNCNVDFFKQWTDETAYVLGFLYADGSLEDAWYLRGKYFRIYSTDYSIVKKIRNTLSSQHTIVKCLPKGNRKPLYLLRIGSHRIYNDLIALGLHPRKSLDIQFPKISHRYLPHFVRGYFDGDGSIVFNRKKWIRVVFTSGSEDFLRQLSNKLSRALKIRERPVRLGHYSYQLYYFTQEGLKVLNFIYQNTKKDKLYLDRKYRFYKKISTSYNYILNKRIKQLAR